MAAMDAYPASSQNWAVGSGQARMEEGLRDPFSSPLSCLLLKEGESLLSVVCPLIYLFRLPWMAQVKLVTKQNQTHKLGRVLIGFGDGRCQLGWKEEKRGKSHQNTLKTRMKLLKNILMTF